MQIDLFVIHLKEFVKIHGIGDDLPSRMEKLREEVEELSEAIHGGNKREIIKEASDVAIIAFHIMLLCRCFNPLWSMYLKLQEVAARPKYRELAKGRQSDVNGEV